MFDQLTDENFYLYASRNYNNRGCTSVEEFYDDLKAFKYLSRLFQRYLKDDQDLQVRLILNHLISLANIFGVQAAVKMLLFKVKPCHFGTLKPFLLYLNYLDHTAETELADVPLNLRIVAELQKI